MKRAINIFKKIEHWGKINNIDKAKIIAMFLMQIALLFAAIIATYEQDWITAFISLSAIIIIWLPSIIVRNVKLHIPLEFEFLLTLFVYASIFLGETQGFYTKFWWWDIVLHIGSGMGFGFIGFLMLYTFHKTNKIVSSPFIISLFSFCFALSLGALWEIFEFAMDSLFGFNMQKSGLVDTMWDLIVDTIGALIVAISGYLYMAHKTRGMGIFQYYLKLFLKRNR